jgi:flagellar protein FlaG
MTIGTISLPAATLHAMPAAPLPGTPEAQAPLVPHPARIQKAPPGPPQVSLQATQQAVVQINKFLQSSSANVEFTVDSKSDQVIVRVVDSKTHQVLRQMPSEEALAISRSLDRMSGLLLEQKA